MSIPNQNQLCRNYGCDNQSHGHFKSIHKRYTLQWVNVDYSSVENNKSLVKSYPWVKVQIILSQRYFLVTQLEPRKTGFAAPGSACVWNRETDVC